MNNVIKSPYDIRNYTIKPEREYYKNTADFLQNKNTKLRKEITYYENRKLIYFKNS